MSTALVPTFPGRPVTVKDADGWTVFVSVHDAWHVHTQKAWKRRIVGSIPSLREGRIRRYKEWLLWEERYYAALGLSLPSSDISVEPKPATPVLHGRWYHPMKRKVA